MKKIFTYLSILAVAAACSPQLEIEYPHEKQAFETRGDRILVEAILPQATAAGDEVYIVGAFNGDGAAVGNQAYKLTRSEAIPAKWGIYLDPSAFQAGKTLADGFTFYNVKQGYERSATNTSVSHNLTIGTGEWSNVYVDKWEAFFDPDSWAGGDDAIVLPDHDGFYRVYVLDKTEWDAIALYMYGDVNNLGGGWPGIASATVEIDGKDCIYFDISADEASGKSEHLIFNNNGGGQQIPDVAEPYITFGDQMDYFFEVTATTATELDAEAFFSGGAGDARAAFTEDSTWGITGSIASTGNNWGNDGDPDIAMKTDGNWHGAFNVVLTTSDQFKFRLGGKWDTNYGGTLTSLGEFFAAEAGGSNLTVPEDGTFDLFLNPTTLQILVVKSGDPVNFPKVEPDEEDGPRIFIRNDVPAWGTNLLTTYWAGGATKSDKGSKFVRTSVTLEEGAYPETFWVVSARHSKRGQEVVLTVFPEEDAIFFYGTDDEKPTDRELRKAEIATKLDTDRYFILSEGTEAGTYKLTEIDMGVHLFVDNQTYWPGNLLAHAWVDDDSGLSTTWPGLSGVPGYDEEQNEYTTFFLPKEFRGKTAEIIFHSDVDDEHNRIQVAINLAKDCTYSLTRNMSADPIERGTAKVYVEDKSGWEDLRLYMWGDKELCGGWPGIAPEEETVKIGVVNYKVFLVPEAVGRSENLILNNNNKGSQTESLPLVLEEEQFVRVETGDEGISFQAYNPTDVPVKIYLRNTTDWDEIALYAWGDAEAFGGWPGSAPLGYETIDGVTYTVFGLGADMVGKSLNLIINNNGKGKQSDNYAFKVPEGAVFLTTEGSFNIGEGANPLGTDSYIYVFDNMGWGENLHLYAWGDSEMFGTWPGAAGEYAGTFCGVPAYRFLVAAEFTGKEEHLIFNNGNSGDGNQFNGAVVNVGKDLFYSIASDFTWADAEPATRVYVLDETGWDVIALYAWGTSDIFGNWPGASPAGTEEIGGVTYKYFEVPASCFGNTANFILNDGGKSIQLEHFDVLKGQIITHDFYFHFTADNVTVVE